MKQWRNTKTRKPKLNILTNNSDSRTELSFLDQYTKFILTFIVRNLTVYLFTYSTDFP